MLDERYIIGEYKSHMYTYAGTASKDVKLICKNVCFVLGGILEIPRKDTIKEMNSYVDNT